MNPVILIVACYFLIVGALMFDWINETFKGE